MSLPDADAGAGAGAGACSSSSSSSVDPLLKELTEKKLSFKRNVVSLATELKDVRSRLASQDHLLSHHLRSRQAAESKAKSMEEEVAKLQHCLQEQERERERDQLTTDQFLLELDDLRSQLSLTRAAADSSALSARSAQAHCSSLLHDLHQNNLSLQQHHDRVDLLAHQLDHLQKLLEDKELSQQQLRDDVSRMEHQIATALSEPTSDSDCQLRKLLEQVSPTNIDNLNRHLTAKDEEIARFRDEIRILSAHWVHKTKELESQLEKQRRVDQELKKKILKLEFCLQESRSQMRKLQRMGEKRDKALKDLREQMSMKQPNLNTGGGSGGEERGNFWESSGFKFMVSVSMLALVIVAKR